MNFYLGIGGNLGDRVKNLRAAIERIKKIPCVKLLAVSSFYETAAWGRTEQPDFLNAAVKISTDIELLKLLDALQEIELELGRVRKEHWGARTIDIDILLADNLKINSERLKIPHPYLFERDFVLIPLSEILPTLKFNLHGDRVEKVSGSPKDFKLKIIACVDKNFGIGYKGELLFKIPEDLKNFRELTLGNTIIFGRKTLETLPNKKPLAGRRNIILSRSEKKIPSAEIVSSVEGLFEKLNAEEKNFVIGGGKIFSELLPYTEEIFLSVVDAEKQADVFFPNFEENFELVAVKKFPNFELKQFRIENG